MSVFMSIRDLEAEIIALAWEKRSQYQCKTCIHNGPKGVIKRADMDGPEEHVCDDCLPAIDGDLVVFPLYKDGEP